MRVLLISGANTVELTAEWRPVAATVYELAVVGGSPGPKSLDCTGRGRDYLGAPVARLRGPFLEIGRIDPNDGLIRALEAEVYPLRPMGFRLGPLAVSALLRSGGLAGPWERRGELFVRPWIVPQPAEMPPDPSTGLTWWQAHGLTESVAAVVCRERGGGGEEEDHGNEEWAWATDLDSDNGRPSAELAQLVADRQLVLDGHLFVDSPDDVTLGEVF